MEKRVSLFGPVLLIGIGVVLLLNTQGILPWGIWGTLVQLWPILLIAAGLDLLLGRFSVWGPLLGLFLVLALLGGALWLSVSDLSKEHAQPGQEIRQSLGDATQAKVVLQPGVGLLRIHALPESADLVRGVIDVSRGEKVEQAYSSSGDRATLELRTSGRTWGPGAGGWDPNRKWDVGLTPGAELEIQASLAMGEALMDLTGLRLSDLQLEVSMGRSEVKLPATGRFEAQIDGAMGVTTVILPAGLAARIRADSGMALRQIPPGFRREGDVYTSPEYDTAANRVDLRISQAMGLLQVRQQ